MKRALSLFIALALIMSVSVLGENTYPEPNRPQTDSLTWDFDTSTGVLSIHGTGPMRSYWEDYPEWDIYKGSILTVRIDEGITSIGDCAFYDCGSLNTAILPDSIETIDRYAFYYCWALQTINIPKHLKYVGDAAFYNTCLHSPIDIVFPEGMEYIGSEAFHSAMKTDGKYVIPTTVSYIGSCALSNAAVSDIVVSENNPYYKSENHALFTKDGKEMLMYSSSAEAKQYSVPNGVQKINEECFNITLHLEKLNIPASVTQIEDAAIFTTFNLSEISVAADNPAYKTINGALCTKDGKELIAFPSGIKLKEIVIPDGIERIAPYVFYGSYDDKLKVVMPDTVKVIGTLAMPAYISSINIPKSVTTIEPYAFFNDGGIDKITYAGSKSDWQKIEIGDGNNALIGVTIQYSK